jgi:hypothetical protein
MGGCARPHSTIRPAVTTDAQGARHPAVSTCERSPVETSDWSSDNLDVRRDLTNRLRDRYPVLAELLAGSRGQVGAQATPFLTRGRIWLFRDWDPHHGGLARIGTNTAGLAVQLSSSHSFAAFAATSGLALDTHVARATYLKTYLSLNSEVAYLVESLADLQFTISRDIAPPHGTPLEDIVGTAAYERQHLQSVRARRAVEDDYGARFSPLCLVGSGPFTGTTYAIDYQGRLMQLNVVLETSGKVNIEQHLLVDHVPVPMSLGVAHGDED